MPKQEKTATEPVAILVGKKPSMNYVLYILNQLKDQKEIIVKARGKAISKAIDVIEILRRRFLPTLKIEKIELGTVEIEEKERNLKRNVSTIEITIIK